MYDDWIIIRVDGGIASQMSFIALGKAFEEKGYKVKYDVSWFEYVGKGFYNTTNGYDRAYNLCFDIPRAFPELPIIIADDAEELRRYEQRYYVDREDVITLQPPLYVGGYLGRYYDFYFAPLFIQHFNPIEAQEINTPLSHLLHQITTTKSCGIHIRRGDLSQNHIVYGEPTNLSYFQKVIHLVSTLYPETKFYLFSDDIAYTKTNIAPLFSHSEFQICNINNPEQGYLDLFLMSKCDIIVASHGSMGVYAKLLSPKNALLISPRMRGVFKELDNVMLVNWGEELQVTKPYGKVSPPPPHYQSKLNWRNKIRLHLYYSLKKKLARKGIIT